MLTEIKRNLLVYELQQLYYPNSGVVGLMLVEANLKKIVDQEANLEDFKQTALKILRESDHRARFTSLGFLYSPIPEIAFERVATSLGKEGEIKKYRQNYSATCNVDNKYWQLRASYYGNNNLHFLANPIYSQNQK
jgi:hypothetical protein